MLVGRTFGGRVLAHLPRVDRSLGDVNLCRNASEKLEDGEAERLWGGVNKFEDDRCACAPSVKAMVSMDATEQGKIEKN